MTVLLTTSCLGDPSTDLIDLARHRLAQIGEELSSIRSDATRSAAETRWESDAARAFHRDADALAADISALASDVAQLRDDLATTRALAAQGGFTVCG